MKKKNLSLINKRLPSENSEGIYNNRISEDSNGTFDKGIIIFVLFSPFFPLIFSLSNGKLNILCGLCLFQAVNWRKIRFV